MSGITLAFARSDRLQVLEQPPPGNRSALESTTTRLLADRFVRREAKR
jgi:hypothetical protein